MAGLISQTQHARIIQLEVTVKLATTAEEAFRNAKAEHLENPQSDPMGGTKVEKLLQKWEKTHEFGDWAPPLRPYPESLLEEQCPGWIQRAGPVEELSGVWLVIAEQFIADGKSKQFDKLIPRQFFIEAVQNLKKNSEAPPYYPNDPKKQATFKYESKRYSFNEDGEVIYKHGLAQLPGKLYEDISEKDAKAVRNSYSSGHAVKHPNGRHLQAPVTPFENMWVNFVEAHTGEVTDAHGNATLDDAGKAKWRHFSIQQTYERLKMGISSVFSKRLVTELNRCCPICKPKMELAAAAAAKAEPRRRATRADNKARGVKLRGQGVRKEPPGK
ncbi:unnamed protein product [Diplocarpon coronariae]|uniref:Uncharacterized protein n=1 Tax=Diplocarpon coronariae TaxID=2795749 RepID=A0A218YVK8_9HELO|nr:hypothetical protein JHW43_003203 [Diplocarpon mali]OWO99838.1 hypothetical protein B2J93_6893 [Marssonina coronariae]